MKIAFAISSLSAGGAERVCTLLCNRWVAAHEVHLMTWQSPSDPVCYPLDPRVKHHALGLLKDSGSIRERLRNNWARIRSLRRLLRTHRPDVLVCFMLEVNVLGIIAARLEGIPVVIAERTHPAHHRVPRVFHIARRLVYPFADRLVVQTRDIDRWFSFMGKDKTSVIANPIELAGFSDKNRGEAPAKRLVSVGRLIASKGFDVLISAFDELSEKHPDWTLHIYGEGEERSALGAQVRRLGLEGRVVLEGHVSDVPDVLRQASVYVSATRYEGFPNAILEACAAGLCVVSTDAPGAIRELLEDGAAGLLSPVDDGTALAANMDQVMGEPERLQALAAKAAAVAQKYDAQAVAGQWITLFQKLARPDDPANS